MPRLTAPAPKLTIENLTSDSVPVSCSEAITPACLQALYGIPATPATEKSNVLGVTALTSFVTEYANQADLKVGVLHRLDLQQ